ncbi:endonuclease domain-containing protein [Franconibacter pulveris]
MRYAPTHARQLRRQLTDQERLLWRLLRDRRFAAHKFRRQHPVGPFILDFACCQAKLAVELDGGQHAEHRAYDARRTAWLQAHGWTVLRFWNNGRLNNQEGVLLTLLAELEHLLPSPRPSPWKGEGENQ